MHFIWDNPSSSAASIIITLTLLVAIYGGLLFTFLKVVKRTSGYIICGVTFGLSVISYLFDLQYVFIAINALGACAFSIILFSNLGDLRSFIANPFKRVSGRSKANRIERIYDREEVYHIIDSTVKALSATKTGAIMTFEKQTNMADFSKNGVLVDAPVTQELLTTIFYPGTRLHDGAVIIRGNTILYAAVFFTPSTKAFAGKYGSRHRAAIGISEVSDSVTVIVSEETGRISFAVNGQIESVEENNFLRVFENYMHDNEDDE